MHNCLALPPSLTIPLFSRLLTHSCPSSARPIIATCDPGDPEEHNSGELCRRARGAGDNGKASTNFLKPKFSYWEKESWLTSVVSGWKYGFYKTCPLFPRS